MEGIDFQVEISASTGDPAGFLFLCPQQDFRTDPSSYHWPDCLAYWSFDPSGVKRLSAEEATQLGFPSLQLNTLISGKSWDASVYAGLHQFHQAKGFDPESQDIARYLGFPLYQLSCDIDAPFAHGKSTNLRQIILNPLG